MRLILLLLQLSFTAVTGALAHAEPRRWWNAWACGFCASGAVVMVADWCAERARRYREADGGDDPARWEDES